MISTIKKIALYILLVNCWGCASASNGNGSNTTNPDTLDVTRPTSFADDDAFLNYIQKVHLSFIL